MSNNNIGIDMVKVARIQKIYDKYGNKFLEKVFNNTEISYIKNKKFKTETIAGMFSFKESISKSLGTGFGEKLKFKDINISHDKLGKPMGKVGDKNFLLSASHDGDYVVTFAMVNNETIEISESIRKLYIPRRDDFHKGDYGKTMIIASSEGMIGSGFLASKAALKAGCGVTYHYVFEEDNIFQSLSIKHTEVILKKDNPIISLEKMNSVLFGCGLGISRKKREVLTELLNSDINLVIDMLTKKYTIANKPIVDIDSKAADSAFSISSDYIEFLENNIIDISAKFFNTASAFDKASVEAKEKNITKIKKANTKK